VFVTADCKSLSLCKIDQSKADMIDGTVGSSRL
jgi:hypothetical protein